ncbi:hypothetical protein [Streptomyces sporangiiformans]|uniref:Transposase n=1 Tax=Streptomyces sporangiiformans TaxID=2315329 RepID=A0A505DFH5_9ACTN|nr:hypothetical protein [Streptomyces sporangiiformans]TPQ15501.1 hypothetical protein FGD71_047010 [Streptomyces sporangiiformans]
MTVGLLSLRRAAAHSPLAVIGDTLAEEISSLPCRSHRHPQPTHHGGIRMASPEGKGRGMGSRGALSAISRWAVRLQQRPEADHRGNALVRRAQETIALYAGARTS